MIGSLVAKIPEELCEVRRDVYLQMHTEVPNTYRSSSNNVVSLIK